MKNRLLLLLVGLVCSTFVLSSNYYVSPQPSGDGLTPSSTCSFDYALDKLAAGDSLFILGGVYYFDNSVIIKVSGVSSKRMTYIGAYRNEKPIFDFHNQMHWHNGVEISRSVEYLHIKGVAICYAGFKGLINFGSYCRIENLDVYGNCDTGIQQKGGKCNFIVNCDSHDNFDYETAIGNISDYGGNADGFADKQYDNSPGNTYIGCRAWNNSDDGWDFFQRVGGKTVLKECVCHHNGPQYYDMSSYTRLKTDDVWFKQFLNDTVVNFRNNTKHICSIKHYYNNGNGNGFKLGGHSTIHNVVLYNCISVANMAKGFDQNSNAGKMEIYDATTYMNGKKYGFYNDNGYSLVIKNSVDLDTKNKSKFFGGTIKSKDNSWDKGKNCSDADFVSLDTLQILISRKADGTLPVTSFLRPKKY